MKFYYFVSYHFSAGAYTLTSNCEVKRDSKITSIKDVDETARLIQEHEGYSGRPTILNFQLLRTTLS